jgi:hypothetical protein
VKNPKLLQSTPDYNVLMFCRLEEFAYVPNISGDGTKVDLRENRKTNALLEG